jgi:hypothetical protein
MPYDIIIPSANRPRRTRSSQGAKPRIHQELIDNEKFQQKLEAKKFISGIEREANEAILCPRCGISTLHNTAIIDLRVAAISSYSC